MILCSPSPLILAPFLPRGNPLLDLSSHQIVLKIVSLRDKLIIMIYTLSIRKGILAEYLEK